MQYYLEASFQIVDFSGTAGARFLEANVFKLCFFDKAGEGFLKPTVQSC